ncbi:50S ribosomal protein L11 methyltransferase [Niabella terrae]
MNDKTMYIQISFQDIDSDQAALLIARLEAAAEGFEETERGLQVYFRESNFETPETSQLLSNLQLPFRESKLPEQNWNQLWESNFEPVTVDDFAGIRAHFHPPLPGVQHEIIITPKMSFGTGHHATTFLMMQAMRRLDFKGKAVLDFGTGTGVLAILAHQLGAVEVLANDIDNWSIENARENFAVNQATAIRLFQADHCRTGQSFDIILANINRNVLLDNISDLAAQLYPGGKLLLSGLLESDQQRLIEAAETAGLILKEKAKKENWICLLFSNL